MRSAIVHRLEAGTIVRFFVKLTDCDESGNFTKLRWALVREMGGRGQWESCLHSHGLAEPELRWLTSSFVIANPWNLFGGSKELAQGYTIISQCDRPAYG
jgi:hypothetical protein